MSSCLTVNRVLAAPASVKKIKFIPRLYALPRLNSAWCPRFRGVASRTSAHTPLLGGHGRPTNSGPPTRLLISTQN